MNTSLKNHRSALLQLEHKLMHELSTIRTQLNQLCPIISLLPTEILQIVFTFCIIHFTQTPLEHRLAFTQVCQHWRSLALGMPGLWNYINLSDVPYAALSLSRSGEALITVVSKSACTEYVGKPVMEGARNRIRKLDVVSFPNSLVGLVCSIAGRRFDLPDWRRSSGLGSVRLESLRELTLRIPGICDPVDLSLLDVQRVTKLVLSGVKVDWSTSRDLEVLDLDRLPGNLGPKLEELLGMLERAGESIKEVCLDDVCCVDVGHLWAERIETPRLRKLSISSKDEELAEKVVSSVTLRKGTEVLVRCGGVRITLVDGKLVNPLAGIKLSAEESSIIGYRYPF
ncbi:hypothetical protein L218DRAFT_113970 [Marasmius fiardii PR-910]|nr:hypothetical protein L218DRAFT_113970 [Marasmius fiardii PR-910]